MQTLITILLIHFSINFLILLLVSTVTKITPREHFYYVFGSWVFVIVGMYVKLK